MQTLTADLVWGAAVAADRINNGYVKESVYDWTKPDERAILKNSNKSMVRGWVNQKDFSAVTAEDIEQGRRLRQHFRSYIFLVMAGNINNFQKSAMEVAELEEFNTYMHQYSLALISSLPSVYRRDCEHKELKTMLRESDHIQGQVGDKVQGEAKIVSCFWSRNFGRYFVTATIVDKVINFWYNNELAKSSVVNIKGKIKKFCDNNVTQLNYVKIID